MIINERVIMTYLWICGNYLKEFIKDNHEPSNITKNARAKCEKRMQFTELRYE